MEFPRVLRDRAVRAGAARQRGVQKGEEPQRWHQYLAKEVDTSLPIY